MKDAGAGLPSGAGWKREVVGLLILLFALFLGGSVLSYSPLDPLFWNVTGPLRPARNLFGPAGSHLGGLLFDVLGFSSYGFLGLCLYVAFAVFVGRGLPSVLRTLLCCIPLILALTGLLDLLFPKPVPFRGGELISGGLLGLHLAGILTSLLNRFGASVLLGAILLLSLISLTRIPPSRFLAAAGKVLGSLRREGQVSPPVPPPPEPAAPPSPGPRNASLQKAPPPPKKPPAERRSERGPLTILTPPKPPPAEVSDTVPGHPGSGPFELPSLGLLEDPVEMPDATIQRDMLEANARRVEEKLSDFGVFGHIAEVLPGPVIAMYEFKPAPGIKISKVSGLADDLALTLKAPSIRIVAPIPGKDAIGIEIPNPRREMVLLKEILASAAYRNARQELPLALGKDIMGLPYVADLTKMPHLLVAGATGAGKSISVNVMLQSLLYRASPEILRLLIIDPKRIELSVYNEIPHLIHPVVTQAKDATKALKWAVEEMERRYMLLSDRGVRNIGSYNRKVLKEAGEGVPRDENKEGRDTLLPYLVVIIDELADLMMVSSKEVEVSIIRLAQMSRAAGIHLIIATQRPSVDVLTGIIKANFPARISFQVSSKVDSRTILDAMGAEALLGEGDMLFMPPGAGKLLRVHGAYVSEDEVKRVTDFLRRQKRAAYDETILSEMAEDAEASSGGERDERYQEAMDIVTQTGQASISMLQRRLRVGYNRAARMIEHMEEDGVVGPSDGLRPREVFGRRTSSA